MHRSLHRSCAPFPPPENVTSPPLSWLLLVGWRTVSHRLFGVTISFVTKRDRSLTGEQATRAKPLTTYPPKHHQTTTQVKVALSEGVKSVWCNPKDPTSMIEELLSLGNPREGAISGSSSSNSNGTGGGSGQRRAEECAP